MAGTSIVRNALRYLTRFEAKPDSGEPNVIARRTEPARTEEASGCADPAVESSVNFAAIRLGFRQKSINWGPLQIS